MQPRANAAEACGDALSVPVQAGAWRPAAHRGVPRDDVDARADREAP
jgi:hypothetical protein